MLNRVVRDIETLEIQGASNVARAGLKALDHVVRRSMAGSKKELIKELKDASKKLIKARETEPMLRNAVRYILWKVDEISVENFKAKAREIIKNLYGTVNDAKKKVFDIGANVINKGDRVLTHCHSTNVMGIIKSAKPREVICTESRPRYQGRLTAKELVKAGINTTMIVDSTVANYIRSVDAVLIGCDVITPNKVVNKIGSRNISLLCEKYDVPLYVCSTSYKFDSESAIGKGVGIEQRSPKEVWRFPPKGLKILNPAFDSIDYDNIYSFINELGLFSPDSLFITLKNTYQWMFERLK